MSPHSPETPQAPKNAYSQASLATSFGLLYGLRLWWDFFFNKPSNTVPDRPIPVSPLTHADLAAAPDGSLWRLGHSTLLFKLNQHFWLTDPVFSQRASPLRWAGPKRFHVPPITLDELPEIEVVILSHDHYDHLDKATVRVLAAKTRHFVTPSRVGDLLIDWGITPEKIIQRDWWGSVDIGEVTLTATPAQHFSGRGWGDRNLRLWCSWVIQSDALTLFFSGDSGYFEGFKAFGERFGPFDVCCLENGAYNERWPSVHMPPEHTVQAFIDLRGRWLLPIHNGTFDLAFHPWDEPLTRVVALAEAQNIPLLTPGFGQCVDLYNPQPGAPWWRAPTTGSTS